MTLTLNNSIMKQKKIKAWFAGLFAICLSSIYAQKDAVASGGDASGSGGKASYSVGQVVYTTNSGSNGSSAQGVQQPYEIYITTGIESVSEINLLVSTYPNPTSDVLNLIIDRSNFDNLSYQLMDINGKLLTSDVITKTNTSISMNELPAAIYFIKIISSNQEIKTFKIIKN